jgi:hypothetical protein
MGTEFIAKTRKSTKKYLDKRRAQLGGRGLFKADPGTTERQFLAKTEGKATLCPGDDLQIEAAGSGIILRRAGKVVGRNERPHPGLKRVIADAGGFFPGAVRNVHKVSSTFEFCVSPPAPVSQPNV